LPLAALFFAISRFLLPVLYQIPILPIFLRPFTAHFLRGSWTLFLPLRHFSLILRAWFLGFTTAFIWEAAESLFETFVSVPVTITHLTTDPNTTLVSGVSSSEVTFKFFALSELRAVATEDTTTASARRTGIFGDHGNGPNLWHQISHECLLILDNDYQHFLRRGQPAPAAPLPPPAKTAPLSDKVPATPAQVIRGPIFRSGGKSSPTILDAFAADGPIAKAVDAGAEAVHVPEIFRSLEAKLPLSPVKKGEDVTQDSNSKPGLLARVKAEFDTAVRSASEKHIPVGMRDMWREWLVWLKAERISKVADVCLPFRELDVVAVEGKPFLLPFKMVVDR
jgi:nucleoporin NDC1